MKSKLKKTISGRVLINFYHHTKSLLKTIFSEVLKRDYDHIEYFVLDSKNLIYVVNSKVACSSIKKSLMKEDNIDEKYDTYLDIHKLSFDLGYSKFSLNKKENEYKKITLVRNPFERIVSLYLNKFRDFEKLEKVGYEYEYYLSGLIKLNISFEEFVKEICNIKDHLADRHFKSQTYLISSSGVEEFYKLEEVDKHYPKIMEKYTLSHNLGHENRTKNYDYKDFYDHKLTDLIYQRYKKDIHDLGYYDEYIELKKYIDLRGG